MNRSWFIACLSLSCGLGTLSLAAEPATAPTESPVPTTQPAITEPAARLDQIIKDLASDDWKLRQQATDSLVDIDASQLPRLRKLIDATKDVDLRNTLLSAVARLEERSLISPSLVTLHVKDASAAETLDALGKQVEFSLVTDSLDWLSSAKLTADIDRQPFWSAMKTLGPQWPVRVNPAPNDAGRLRLLSVGNDYLNPNSIVAGPFLICPISLQTNGTIDLLAPAPAFKFRNMMLQLAILPEPKLRTSRLRIAATDCVDEKGNKIKTADDANGRIGMAETPVSQGSTVLVRLFPQGDIGRKIATLTGVIRFRMPVRSRHIEMDDLFNNKEKQIDLGGRQVKVTVVQQEKDYLVKLALPANVNIQDETSLAAVRDMTLLDSAGNPLFRRGTTQAMVNQNWEFSTVFAREGISFGPGVKSTGEAAKLVWEMPIDSKNLEQPFELKDIQIAP